MEIEKKNVKKKIREGCRAIYAARHVELEIVIGIGKGTYIWPG